MSEKIYFMLEHALDFLMLAIPSISVAMSVICTIFGVQTMRMLRKELKNRSELLNTQINTYRSHKVEAEVTPKNTNSYEQLLTSAEHQTCKRCFLK